MLHTYSSTGQSHMFLNQGCYLEVHCHHQLGLLSATAQTAVTQYIQNLLYFGACRRAVPVVLRAVRAIIITSAVQPILIVA